MQGTYEPFHDTDYYTSAPDQPDSAPEKNESKARGDPPEGGFQHGKLHSNSQPAQTTEEDTFPLRCSTRLCMVQLHETRSKSHKEQYECQTLSYSHESQRCAAQELAGEFKPTKHVVRAHVVNVRITVYMSNISRTQGKIMNKTTLTVLESDK